MKPYQQGNLDYLCGIYSSINAVLQSTEGITQYKRKQVRKWFELILVDLSKHRKLLDVCKYGSSVKTVERYLNILQTELKDNIKIKYARPFNERTRLATVLKKMSVLACQPHISILIGISGLYEHWSLVAKTTADRIYLNDSDSLKYLNIKNIPKCYDLIRSNIIVIKSEPV